MWLKPPENDKSASFTLAIGASVIAAGVFIASLWGVPHPQDGLQCAGFATPFLALYSFRHGKRKPAA